MQICQSAYYKCLRVCVCVCIYLCVCVGAATLCLHVQPLHCAAGAATRVTIGWEWKWRQMNREELKHSCTQLRVTSPPSPPFSFPCPPSLPLLVKKYGKSTRKEPRRSNEKRKSVALFVALSRHRQLIPQRWLLKGYNTSAKTSGAGTQPIYLRFCQPLSSPSARVHLMWACILRRRSEWKVSLMDRRPRSLFDFYFFVENNAIIRYIRLFRRLHREEPW